MPTPRFPSPHPGPAEPSAGQCDWAESRKAGRDWTTTEFNVRDEPTAHVVRAQVGELDVSRFVTNSQKPPKVSAPD